jgi:hypothetical protein
MHSKSEDVNGYSQVHGPAFSHNPWDTARLHKNVDAIYDDLIAGVPKGAGKKLSFPAIATQYGNLLPSGMSSRSLDKWMLTAQVQPSIKIKRARYVQLCAERRTEVAAAVKEEAARKRAAKQLAGKGKKRRKAGNGAGKVAKQQPGPSSDMPENALEVEDLFTDGAGAGGDVFDVLGLADWLGLD